MRRRFIITLAFVAVVAGGLRLAEVKDAHHERSQAAARIDDGVLRIVILGDSVAHGAGDESGRGIAGDLTQSMSSLRRCMAITNLSVNGSRTWNVLRVVAQQQTHDLLRAADAIVISIGGNDLYGDSTAQALAAIWPALMMNRTLDRIEAIVSGLHRENPAARVFLLGLYNPYRGTSVGSFLDRQVNVWDSRLILRFSSDSRVDVIRIADLLAFPGRLSPLDHFHPSALGYALITSRIEGAL